MIKNARKMPWGFKNRHNPRHVHTSVRPYPAYNGLAYCYRGTVCCSFCEGDYKLPDGSFDVERAQRAALAMNKLALKRRANMRDLAAYYDREAAKARANANNVF